MDVLKYKCLLPPFPLSKAQNCSILLSVEFVAQPIQEILQWHQTYLPAGNCFLTEKPVQTLIIFLQMKPVSRLH